MRGSTQISLPFLKKLEEPQSPITTFDLKSVDRLGKAFKDHGEDLTQLWSVETAFHEEMGEMVKGLRLKKNVDLMTVSNATDIPLEVLEDLEEGDFFPKEIRASDIEALSVYYGVKIEILPQP